MKKINMIELYRRAQAIKEDMGREDVFIGDLPRFKPKLPAGEATGVIDRVEVVEGNGWKYLKFIITFALEDGEDVVTINKNIFINRGINSEFVVTMKKLLGDYSPGQRVSSRDLEGLIVDVEISHKTIEGGKISEISTIYGLHKQRISEFKF